MGVFAFSDYFFRSIRPAKVELQEPKMQIKTQMGVVAAVLLIFAAEVSAQSPVPHLAQGQSNHLGESMAASEPERQFQYIHGRLSYRKKTASGEERGREDWWLTRNRDGSRTMRSLAMTDDSKFVRDVSYTLGADERPLQVFIQLQVDEQWVGSGYFRVTGDTMNLVTDSIHTGHTVQSVHVPPRFHVLTHAVMLDGWPAWAFDQTLGGSQTIAVYSTSQLWNGTDGPLGRMTKQQFTLIGTEAITVPAGTFQARRFRIGDNSDPASASDIWVTGEHNILVKYDWPSRGLEYVLVSLTTETQTDEARLER